MNEFTKEELRNFTIGLSVLAFCLLAFLIFKLNHTEWENAENTDYVIYATYNRTDGLEIGDKVRMAGIDIGYVADSVLDEDFRATLTFKIPSKNERIGNGKRSNAIPNNYLDAYENRKGKC